MSKLSSQKHKEMNHAFLRYPTKSDLQISKIISISQPTVSKYRKEYLISIDTEFIAITAGKFISEFGQAMDHWKILIDEIEDLKKQSKTIMLKDENGNNYEEDIDLSPLEKLPLIHEQAQLREKILFLASQGEVREVIKLMRVGKLPIPAA